VADERVNVPVSDSVLSLEPVEISMCLAGYRVRIRSFHSAIDLPYFSSMEGK
jgi:hypothetical protein